MAADHRKARPTGDFGKVRPRSAEVLPGALASLDRTLPPTPLKDLLAADGASVFVCSVDVELVQAVQEAGGEQYPIFIVHEWSELLAAVETGSSKIVLLDLDALPAGIEAALAALKSVSQSLIVLAAAQREEAQTLMALLSDRRIHRLLIKPAAVGITRLLLESAVSRYLQLREQPEAAAEHPLEETARRPWKGMSSAHWPAWIAVTAIVSVLLGAVLVGGLSKIGLFSDDTSPSSAVTVAPAGTSARSRAVEPAAAAAPMLDSSSPSVEPSPTAVPDALSVNSAALQSSPAQQLNIEPDPFAERLMQAEQAAAEGRRSQPVGDSALDYYAAVLAAAPEHVEASQRLTNLLDALYSEVEAALLEGSLQTASLTLGDIERVAPASGRVSFLKAQLDRALDEERANIASEALAPSAAEPSDELQSLLTIARTRLQRDQLLKPDGDSARAYLERAALLNPNDPRVLAFRSALAGAVASSARMALDRDDTAEAADLISGAFALGADRETLALLDIDLAAARQSLILARQTELLASAATRLRAGQLVTPSRDSAFHYLSELREENPEHPELALRWRQFADSAAANARESISAGNWEAAQTFITAIESAAIDSDLVDSLRYEWQQGQFLAIPAPRGALRLLDAPPPEYPDDALRSQIEGWVDLDLIVDREGHTRAISVIASEPERRFDAAALESVSRQRYEPFELDGRLYERRLQLRVRFTLN